MKCNQTDCDNPPVYRFTWPWEDEAHIRVIQEIDRALAGAQTKTEGAR